MNLRHTVGDSRRRIARCSSETSELSFLLSLIANIFSLLYLKSILKPLLRRKSAGVGIVFMLYYTYT